ncbi:hypothetical protein RCL1_007699 [Eukaryota sp. TZLM3-RCL]
MNSFIALSANFKTQSTFSNGNISPSSLRFNFYDAPTSKLGLKNLSQTVSTLLAEVSSLRQIVEHQAGEIHRLSSQVASLESVNEPEMKRKRRETDQDSSNIQPFPIDPFHFISTNFRAAYEFFGGQVKFTSAAKGRTLSLLNNDMTAVHCGDDHVYDNLFVAINCTVNSKFSLSRISNRELFGAYIGFFNPNMCQAQYNTSYFTGVYVCHDAGLMFLNTETDRGGKFQVVVPPKNVSLKTIQVLLCENSVVFSIPLTSIQVEIQWPHQYVFGISIDYEGESWTLSE